MIDKLLKYIIGGRSKRYRLTILFIIITAIFAWYGKMDTWYTSFCVAYGSWIAGDSYKKGSDK